MYGPCQLPDRASVISGRSCMLGGIVFVYVCLEYSSDPSEGLSGQLAYTFCSSYPIDVSHLSFISSLSAAALGLYLCGRKLGEGGADRLPM
jgi:hypothetical protein